MDLFIASGAPQHKVERFLDADPQGTGSARDQIAADMANDLMSAFGRAGRQTPREVKRLRERGAWVHLGQRPRE